MLWPAQAVTDSSRRARMMRRRPAVLDHQGAIDTASAAPVPTAAPQDAPSPANHSLRRHDIESVYRRPRSRTFEQQI